MLHLFPSPYYEWALPCRDCIDQGKDIFWIMLSICIDCDSPIRHLENRGKPCQQRSSFPLVLLVAYHCCAGK